MLTCVIVLFQAIISCRCYSSPLHAAARQEALRARVLYVKTIVYCGVTTSHSTVTPILHVPVCSFPPLGIHRLPSIVSTRRLWNIAPAALPRCTENRCRSPCGLTWMRLSRCHCGIAPLVKGGHLNQQAFWACKQLCIMKRR